MEKGTGLTDVFLETSEWYGSDSVDHTNEDASKNDDDSSDNESWSSYDNLPEEDFQKKEDGACSENEDIDVRNEENHGVESFGDNISQVRSKLLDVIQ